MGKLHHLKSKSKQLIKLLLKGIIKKVIDKNMNSMGKKE